QALGFFHVAPLAHRQVAQHQIANTHALQTHNLQTDQFTHAANLAFLAFAQDKTQLVIVLPGHLGWQQGLTVQAQTKVQQFQTALAQLAGYTHQIFLVDDRVFANNLPRNTTILSQDQKAGGINIQTTSRSQTAQMRRVKALTTAATLVLRGGTDQGNRIAITGFSLPRHIAYGLVQQDSGTLGLTLTRLFFQCDFLIGVGFAPQFRDDLTVHTHPAALDESIRLTA